MACTHLLLSLLYQQAEEIHSEIHFFLQSNIFILSREYQTAPAGNVTGTGKLNNVPKTFISFVSYW